MNIYDETEKFYAEYRGEKKIYGKSVEGRALFAMFIGKHEFPVGISQYAIHGREWSTALLAFEHIKRGVKRGGVWVLPLTNPDGALLSQEGLSALSPKRRAFALACNGESEDFSLWKANAEGVDLNVNFDARWGTGTQNVFSPAPENFVGKTPLCAPESRALWTFTEAVFPDFTLSFHTKGEEIYWRFHEPPLRAARDKKLAKRLSESTGYPLGNAEGSAGGYKDMCIEKLKIPAFTVECGENALSHPIGREKAVTFIKKCDGALLALTEGF